MKKADAIIVLLVLSIVSALTVYSIPPAQSQSPTFKMAANPSSLTFPTGSHKTSNITITSLYGFTGTISLSGESFPYQQVSVTLNVTSVSLPPYGVAYALANVSASSTTTPYNYTIDVNGSGPGGYETAFLFALVTPGPATIPDFRLSASPDYLSAAPGTVHNVTVSVASLDGFVGEVGLRVFYPPSRLNASLVYLTAGSILNQTLTIPTSCPVYPPQGPGSSQVDANSTSLHHWLDVYILVATSSPSFCFTANPRLVGAVAGSWAETQFVTIGLGGFNNTVVLSAQSSFQVTFLPGNLSGLARTNPQLFNILVYVPPSTAVGNQTVVVRGTSGAVSWSDNLTVMVTIGPYYSVSTNPGSLTIPEGSSGAATISLTGENGFSRNDVGASLPISSPLGLSGKMDPGRYATPYGFYVYNGYTTTLSVTVNASVARPGHYTLVVPLNTVYSPYVENYAIFQVSVTSPGPDFFHLSQPYKPRSSSWRDSNLDLDPDKPQRFHWCRVANV